MDVAPKGYFEVLLDKFDFWQIMVILVLICGTIIFLAIKGFWYKGEKRSFGLKRQSKEVDKKSRHSNCPNSLDLSMIVYRVTEAKHEIDSLLFYEKVNIQMRYAKEKILIIKERFLQDFSTKLRGKIDDSEDLWSHPSYRGYETLLDLFEKTNLEFIRISFEVNHFDSLSELQFEKYVNQKVDFLTNLGVEFFNRRFFDTPFIKRGDIKLKEELLTKIKKDISDIYYHALDEALKVNKRIEVIEANLKDFLKDLGVPSKEI